MLEDSEDIQLSLLSRDDSNELTTERAITRPIHYLGSKLRILGSIREALDFVEPTGGRVCDLFAGSGTVSLALSATRSVIAVDIQEYSRVLCSALLNPSLFGKKDLLDSIVTQARSSTHYKDLIYAIEPLMEHELNCLRLAESGEIELLCDLVEQGSILAYELGESQASRGSLRIALSTSMLRLKKLGFADTAEALATRYFGGIYYSYSQAAQLDAILEAIANLVPVAEQDGFQAALLSTASEVVNTVGRQFAQPIRFRTKGGHAKRHLVGQVLRDRSVDASRVFAGWLSRYSQLPPAERRHEAVRADYREALASLGGKVSAVYADPPYTRDHYSRYYHVLETLCLRDNPAVSTVLSGGRHRLSRGLYRASRHQSPFCIMSQGPEAFSALFHGVQQLDVPLVLSYSPYNRGNGSRPRVLMLEDIQTLAQRVFSRVTIVPAGRMAHSKLNAVGRNAPITYDAEVLIVCQP